MTKLLKALLPPAFLALSAAMAPVSFAADETAHVDPVTIVVEFKTKAGRQDDAKAVVDSILPHVLAEDGNVNVLMFQDPEDPTRFLFIETFTSPEAEIAHTQTPHMQRFYQEISEPLEDESTIQNWKPYGLFQGAGADAVT